MKVLLTGASGFIGRNTLTLLEASGHQVVPVSRRYNIDFNEMLTPESWFPYLEGIDAVFNCVGIIGEIKQQRFETLHTLAPMALFQACTQAGVSRVVQISALGADDTAFSDYHLSKRMADDFLRSLDLDWVILRPSLVYGRGGGSSEVFMTMAKLPVISVVGNGQQLLQPIHVSDVAVTVLSALTTTKVRQTLDVVGTEVVSFEGWLQCMRRAQGLTKGNVIHIPVLLVSLFFQLGKFFSPMLQPDNLRMLQTSYKASAQPLTQFLGSEPLSIQDELFYSSGVKQEK